MGQLESFNPATGELVGKVTTIEPGEVQAVVDDVAEVQPFWAQLSLEDRARYMLRAADVLVEDMEEVADLLTREQGKPIVESYVMELIPTIDALHWCAKAAPKILADEKIRYPQAFLKTKKSFFSYEPLGVVGVIAPWNYPWSIPFGEVAMALMAGNGVVLKPASLTPLLGERIQKVFDDAGFPEGLVRTVHGGGQIGQALCEASTAKIFFTGSVEVGRKVGEICAHQLKGSVLELGGKDPQIVCADADLANAVSGCVWGAFANAGQTCSGIERTYVVESVADQFLAGVRRETERLTVGDPLDWVTEIGPMVSAQQADLVTELVDDAIASGAERLTGGPREIAGYPGRFIAPTVLAGVEDDMRIMREEIFGPVAPVVVVARRGRGARARERLQLRPRRLGLDHRPREGRADRAADRVGHGLDQRPLLLPRRDADLVGRGQGLGPRPLALEVRPLRVLEHQARGLRAGLHPRLLVAALRRRPRHGAALVGADPLRARRDPPAGPERGHRPAREGRRQDPAQGPLTWKPNSLRGG